MYTYYYIIAAVIVVGFLFMMWRDVRTLRSRVTDVVEQHNNVKKVLDRHGSLLTGMEIPVQFSGEPVEDAAEPMDPMDTEIRSDPLPQIKEEPGTEKPKQKKPKASSAREKEL
jgi:hypothetical protein